MSTIIDGSAGVTTNSGAVYNGLQQGTAVATTSGTSITFSSIPSWVKRITFIFNEFSTNGSAHYLVQIGSGSATTTGYVSTGSSCNQASATGGTNSTNGFVVRNATGAGGSTSGIMTIVNVSGTTWISSHTFKSATTEVGWGAGSSPAIGAAIDRVVLTTTNGTDTFDAGSVNIIYE